MASGLIVKNNLSALNTLNVMNINQTNTEKQMKKVSSGMKINGAADDASGYQISERMRVQIRSLDQANQNTQNGSALMKTAEGAVSSTVEILKTLKEKVINAANGTNTESELNAIQAELDQSIDQINDNANVQFNGKYLVDGSLTRDTKATANVFKNNKLNESTTGASTLTALTDRSGGSVGIVSGDKVTVSYTIGGKTTTTTIDVDDSTDLNKILNKIGTGNAQGSYIGIDASGYSVYTADGASVVTVTATASGFNGQIAGFSISVADKDGNIKKNVNKILDDFSEAISAEDKRVDQKLVLQVGTRSNQSIAVSIRNMNAQALGLQGTNTSSGTSGMSNLNVTTQEKAMAAINVLDAALQRALTEQTKIGSVQSRLEYTSTNLTTASENVTNSESTIRDADMAKEMTAYTKNNILKQTAQSMLAQANQSGQGVLSLLQ